MRPAAPPSQATTRLKRQQFMVNGARARDFASATHEKHEKKGAAVAGGS
jgi:hypothetical protein